MKPRVIFGVVLALLLGTWIALQPVFAFQALRNAALAGHRDRLAALVDFPALREDLKTKLSDRFSAEVDRDKGRQSPFGALGALLASGVVDQLVDAVVTPDGVAAIARTGRAPMSDLGGGKPALPPPPETAPPSGQPGSQIEARPKTSFAYEGLNRFKATTVTRDGTALGWVLERRGLGWKLAGMELPELAP